MIHICSLIPRPSHHPIFNHLQYTKTEGGRPGPFYHVNDVLSTQVDRRGGEGSPIERTHFACAFFVLKQEWYVFFCFMNVRNSSSWGRNYKIRPQACSFNRASLPLCLPRKTKCHSCNKMDQASPLHFCILQVIKNWMVGRPGNEANIYVHSQQLTDSLTGSHCISSVLR